MRISDWSSDVCSSDLLPLSVVQHPGLVMLGNRLPTAFADVGCCFWLATLPAKLLKPQPLAVVAMRARHEVAALVRRFEPAPHCTGPGNRWGRDDPDLAPGKRSEERSVGKEFVSTCRSTWSPSHSKIKRTHDSNTQ